MAEKPTDGASTEMEHATGSVRELREYSRGVLDVEHRDVYPLAGLVHDPEVREVLSFMAESYDPTPEQIEAGMPRSFWETTLARRAIRQHATDVATDAVRDGNVTQSAFLTGLPSYESDVSGLQAIMQLAEWLVDSEQCKLIYLAALMGRGKTDLSLTFMEIVADHFERVERAVGDQVEIPTPEIAANFHVETPDGCPEVAEINHYDKLTEWMRRGDSSQERWFIFDEASSELTAQNASNAQKVVKRMGGLVKKMRKMGVNMVVIGHDKGDVHVAIRSLADFVDKTGLKSASFYSGIKNREPTGHLFDVDGIPPTAWGYDTDDTADWCWCDDEAEGCPHAAGAVDDGPEGWTDKELKREMEERAARLWWNIDELRQTDVAEYISTDEVSISTAGITRAKERLGLDENGSKQRAKA